MLDYCDRIVHHVELSQCKGSGVAQGRISMKLLFGGDEQDLGESTAQEDRNDLFLY